MGSFQARPKPWGNSLGIVLPREIVEREHLTKNTEITIIVIPKAAQQKIKETFGTLKLKISTSQAMREIDEGYD